ncbi:amidohydrolase [Marinitenerispora sediminis]|uniref:Amidohydrolase n=2 Tax=Marinitenerispora sediminis TaxID=1931232 RepID=A0A368T5L2_9ACTN|nr:amidohydrolase [Marinitenerispora sediminis]RCV54552.1 amidohydrolase [Marinitenerispora sediminis]RCV58794.1 amidohydrolase [Marinitenerispora sediminis]
MAGYRPGGVDPAALADLYRDLHTHPELSFAEHRTAGAAARRLRDAGYEVAAGVGGTGVVGVLRNGPGPVVLLRADMDALPVREQTGLPYASTAQAPGPDGVPVPVMHACGHDMHVSCLVGAAELLSAGRAHWGGTVMAVFQPAEEIGAGARAMLDDGLYGRFGTPDAVFAQHVFPLPAGRVAYRPGLVLGAAESFDITLFGVGGHASQPERVVDPVVMAAATVLRLQTVVAREVAPAEQAVLTVAKLRAGEKENVIADHATLTVSIRAYDQDVLRRVVAAVHRIADAEAAASGAPRPPEYRAISSFPTTVNDPEAAEQVGAAFRARFGAERVGEMAQLIGSEDVGVFGTAAGVPSVFWGLGAAAAEGEAPGNHTPHFAPVVEPTLSAGVEALVAAALTRLVPVAG